MHVTWGDHLPAQVEVAAEPQTELWPVMYDFDNSGKVDLPDLSLFASAYGYPVGGGTPGNDWTWVSDHDASGVVDLSDLSFFAPNFGRAVADGQPRTYPDNFPADWRGQPLRAAAWSPPANSATPLIDWQLAPLFDAAVARLGVEQGDAAAAALQNVTVDIVDLPGEQLGRAFPGSRIEIDISAAGYGWFIDPTPWDDTEFDAPFSDAPLPHSDFRIPTSMDLLTVIMHGLGHVLGHGHDPDGLMDETLSPGTRRLPDDDTIGSLEDAVLDQITDRRDLDEAAIDRVFASLDPRA